MRLAATLLLALAALALAVPAAASEERPTPAEVESELICPVCETTLDTSNAPIALRMKETIRARIAAGATKSEIKDEFVAQFGTGVLAVPPKRGRDLVVWLLPVVGILVAALAVGLLARSWTRRGEEPAAVDDPGLDPELERRVDAELARFE